MAEALIELTDEELRLECVRMLVHTRSLTAEQIVEEAKKLEAYVRPLSYTPDEDTPAEIPPEMPEHEMEVIERVAHNVVAFK